MKTNIILAWRNLWRNKRRTLIAISSITFSVLLASWMRSMQEGSYESMIDNVVKFYSGYLQVQDTAYWDERTLENTFEADVEIQKQIAAIDHVTLVSNRLESFALAANHLKSKPAMVMGIEPEAEDRITKLSQKIKTGSFLQKGDKSVVITKGLLNFDGAKSSILQSHMLEINPEIAAEKPRIEVHFLGIGDAGVCARLIFQAHKGEGIAATIVDMGNRFRMIVNEVKVIEPKKLPKLPVACALWIPQPNLEVGAGAWITAGGTHHSSFSFSITTEMMEDYAEIADIEMLIIDENTNIRQFKQDIRNNEVYYMLNKALR